LASGLDLSLPPRPQLNASSASNYDPASGPERLLVDWLWRAATASSGLSSDVGEAGSSRVEFEGQTSVSLCLVEVCVHCVLCCRSTAILLNRGARFRGDRPTIRPGTTKIASSFSAEQMDVAAMDVKAVVGFLRGLSLDKVRALS
jgi:hypothetical protein